MFVVSTVGRLGASNPVPHSLSTSQIASIRAAMHLFVEDDESSGHLLDQRRYCDACERVRPAAGFIQYGRYALCNPCATTYEIARARGMAVSAGQYVRDRRFGETLAYTADDS